MKVILATDGTRFGNAAAHTVKKLNLGPEDSLLILTVVDMGVPGPIDIYGGYLPDPSDLERAARENAEKVVGSTRGEISQAFEGKGLEITTDIQFGSPDSRIVETAERTGADLIIIGSHGYKRWERILLGSVSSSVVHHAPCSVLVVRSDDE